MYLLASSTQQRLQPCLLAVPMALGMASNQLLRGLFPFHYIYACATQRIHGLYTTSAVLKSN